jgi:hypothetical protein
MLKKLVWISNTFHPYRSIRSLSLVYERRAAGSGTRDGAAAGGTVGQRERGPSTTARRRAKQLRHGEGRRSSTRLCGVAIKGAGWNGLGVARRTCWAWLSVRCPPPLDKLIVVLPEMGPSFSELQRVRAYGTASAREWNRLSSVFQDAGSFRVIKLQPSLSSSIHAKQ